LPDSEEKCCATARKKRRRAADFVRKNRQIGASFDTLTMRLAMIRQGWSRYAAISFAARSEG